MHHKPFLVWPAAAVVLVLAAGAGSAQTLAPAAPPPEDYAGTEFVDSRGCVFVRATSNGAVIWLPRLDAQRRPLCGSPAAAGEAQAQTQPVPAPATDPVVAAEPVPVPPVAQVPAPDPAGSPPDEAPLAEADRPATDPSVPSTDPPAPAPAAAAAESPALALPGPLAPLAPAAPAADPGQLTQAEPPGVRLIFVEPDDRVRIVHVDVPSRLIGGDSAFPDLPARRDEGRIAAHGAIVGYYPRPTRLSAAPPIRGFGPDPAPEPRAPRRHSTG